MFYNKLRKDLEDSGFVVNPYDPCVANKEVRGSQITVVWHVDDMKISHKQPEVVSSFMEYIEKKYGSIGKVKVTRGKIHEYLGMTLDYSENGKVKIDMTKYIKKDMIAEFPKKDMEGTSVTPANDNLFKVNEHSPPLGNQQKKASIQWLLRAYSSASEQDKRFRLRLHSYAQESNALRKKIGTSYRR